MMVKVCKLFMMLSAVMMLSSCAAIRYGRSTTVTIEADREGDVVNILAIGPKQVNEIQNVVLPYKYKVKHNNLPQRLDITSQNCIYDPVTIGAVRKGVSTGRTCRFTGWTFGSALMIFGASGLAMGVDKWGKVGLAAGAALMAPMLAIGYTAKTDIPDKESYHTTSVVVGEDSMYKLEGWYQRQRAIADVYILLSKGHYTLAQAKIAYLTESESNAELLYLRGLNKYFSGDIDDAMKDWKEAKASLGIEVNPGLSEAVATCIQSVDEGVSLRRLNLHKTWKQVGENPVPESAGKYSSAGSVSSEEMGKYLRFCRYNKKGDGTAYSIDEFREFLNHWMQ